MCYDQYKQRSEISQGLERQETRQNEPAEEEISTNPLPECSKEFSKERVSNTQGGGKPVNLGTNKFGDSPREPLKCWECGEPHLRRNYPRLTSTTRTTIHNLQEASTVGYVGRILHRINVVVDGRQVDHQSTIVEVEGKVNNARVSVLIDPGATLSYISPGVVASIKLKKRRHAKSWILQLATRNKRKSI
jgi:hypothetical protein